jgi:hypothetical protein
MDIRTPYYAVYFIAEGEPQLCEVDGGICYEAYRTLAEAEKSAAWSNNMYREHFPNGGYEARPLPANVRVWDRDTDQEAISGPHDKPEPTNPKGRNMTTQTNTTPFIKAIEGFLAHAEQTDSKYMNVLLAMNQSEVSFPKEWTEKFLKTSGEDKSDMIDSTFRRLELPGYAELHATAKERLNKDASEADQVAKEVAQKKLHSLFMMLKDVAVALAFFQIKNVTNVTPKAGGRVAYVVDGAWCSQSKKGESFNSLKAAGREAAKEAGWIEVKSTPRTPNGQTVSVGAATDGTSTAQEVNKVNASGGAIQPVGVVKHAAEAIKRVLETKPLAKMADDEQNALVQLCYDLCSQVFADKSGMVDLEDLQEWIANHNQKREESKAA